MATSYALKPYNERLQVGLEYQDFLVSALLRFGIIFQPYSSKKYQVERGESLCGLEVKWDGLFQDTGNLAIETAEKSYAEQEFFKPSGIFREDNSCHYLVGNYEVAYLFSVKYLRAIYMSRRNKGSPYLEKEIGTSKFFLMPITDAEKYCDRLLRFNQ